MNSILKNAVNAINAWNEIRNNGIATSNYFNQGAYFPITATDFAAWDLLWKALGEPEDFELHAYFGIQTYPNEEAFSLSFYCVDSATDQKEVSSNKNAYLANIKHLSYEKGNIVNAAFDMSAIDDNTMDPLSALQASTQWDLHKDLWLANQTNMAQILIIPFKDLVTLFDKGATSVICLPALKLETTTKNLDIDLILWGHNSKGIIGRYPADFIKPAPPFSSSLNNFQLYNYAL